MERCLECGESGRPLAGGICVYRGGCEHRVLQHEAEMSRLNIELARLDPLACGHCEAEHDNMRRDMFALLRSLREGYGEADENWPEPVDGDWDW